MAAPVPAAMPAAPASRDWTASFARRTRLLGGGEITAILALAGATDVITFSGGFPAPETFPVGVLDEISRRLLTQDAAVALQYSATEGLASLRGYLAGRLESLEGVRPGPGELMVTSGGIDCMELLAKSLIDPGDVVAAEAPTYLGAIMAFRGYEADVRGVPMDAGGMRVDALEDLLRPACGPSCSTRFPTTRIRPACPWRPTAGAALVNLARRYGFLILEDVAYRELGFDDARPPSLWALAPDMVVQAGTFSKIFFPGVRLGWAAGPSQVIAQLAVAKQNSDQCSGALGQRMLEEYGRGGHLDPSWSPPRALYERRAGLDRGGPRRPYAGRDHLDHAARRLLHLGDAARGGGHRGARARRPAAKVAYVPGRPFYPPTAPGRASCGWPTAGSAMT